MTIAAGDDAYKSEEDNQPVPLIQAEHNDQTRNLNFPKKYAQLLVSRHIQKHLLAPVTMCYWYRDYEWE